MYPNQYQDFYNYSLFNDGYYRAVNDIQIANEIQRAINGEYSAIACYQQLANMAPTQVERDQILEIREDEIRHFKEFSSIYMNLTGRQPTPQIIEECPDTYHLGLEAAFKDEQETADFYLDIVDKAQNMYIKDIFRRAAADEQNHAVWFLYFLSKME
jgi:rubrerythrin